MNLCRLLSACCLVFFSTPVRSESILVPKGQKSVWQYLDAGQPADKAWATPGFDASKWKSGPAPLGYGEKDMATTVSFGPDAMVKPVTTYFRHTLEVADPALFENIVLRLRRDDGAVVYWNGTEVVRSNMPSGPITPDTCATTTLNDSMERFFHTSVFPVKGTVQKGTNVIDVEVHQCEPASSDLIFDLEIAAFAKGEELPQMEYFAAAVSAMTSGNRDRAYQEILKLDPKKEGYAEFISGAPRFFAERGVPDEHYLTVLDKAYDAAPSNMEVVYAWIRARVDTRRGFSIKPARRPVPDTVPAKYKFIADTPPAIPGEPSISPEKLLADVDDLELILENCYAYLERRGADYRGALDALRASLTKDTPRSVFQHRVSRLMTIFGDPHSAVRDPKMPRPVFHGLFVMDGDQLSALLPGRAGLYLEGFPHIVAINGRPAGEWVKAAENIVAQCSPQFRTLLALRQLEDLATVSREMGAPATAFSAEFQSADGKEKKTQELRVGLAGKTEDQKENEEPGPPDGPWPRTESQKRKENVGYLRLPEMGSGDQFVASLNKSMKNFKDTRGLIVDVRGNGGGTQDAVQTLLPWFMKPGSPLKVINIAAYRIPVALPKKNLAGFLGMNGRGLHPLTSEVWSFPQALRLKAFQKTWTPAWKIDPAKFSDWHFMALTHESNPKAGYYDKPVIVLMDAGCFSATDNFLGAFKGHPNVTLMGTPSGGGSGRMAPYTLPNSRTHLTLCQMVSFATDGRTYDGNGVEPDVILKPRLDDQIDGRGDSVLEAAVARLAK